MSVGFGSQQDANQCEKRIATDYYNQIKVTQAISRSSPTLPLPVAAITKIDS